MQSVKFTRPWKIWSAGDIAGFEAGQAQRLIDGKVAEKYTAPAESAAADAGASAGEQTAAGAEGADSGDPKAKSAKATK